MSAEYTEPCKMRLYFATRDCGKPATRGWLAEDQKHLVPCCEDCWSSITPRPVVSKLRRSNTEPDK